MGVAFSNSISSGFTTVWSVLTKLFNYVTKGKGVQFDLIFNLVTNYSAVFTIFLMTLVRVYNPTFKAVLCPDDSDINGKPYPNWTFFCSIEEKFVVTKKSIDDFEKTIEISYINIELLPLSLCVLFTYLPYYVFKVTNSLIFLICVKLNAVL